MVYKHHSSKIAVVQALIVAASFTFAWLIRFDFRIPHARAFLLAMPLLIVVRLVALAWFNLLHGYWGHTGISDGMDILKAVTTGSIAYFAVMTLIVRPVWFPVSAYVLEWVLSLGMLAAARIAVVGVERNRAAQNRQQGKSVLIVGAGSGAAALLNELMRNGYSAVAVVDDDSGKHGIKFHGAPVVGGIDQLPEIANRLQVEEIIISIPSATAAQMRRIVQLCEKSGIAFRTIPGLADLIDGRVTVAQLRPVKAEDLLSRAPIRVGLCDVRQRLEGRVVMVTGAAGSIGSELCRQIVEYKPAMLVAIDHAETPLFYLQQALRDARVPTVCQVADIADTERMQYLILKYEAQAIFHAAAYKHVPMMEENLSEALKNNVFALQSLIDTAKECGCGDFVLISSDKAVNPTSFMGCTKRVGELILASQENSDMRCVSVRFGNVLGSQGSVIPVFQEQIRTKRQITITHPEITRYFMTIPEAVSLVLQGFAIGEDRDVLILDMGDPVRIVDLARDLVKMCGFASEEVKFVYTGLRPGEKMHEELFYDSESALPTKVQKIRRTHSSVLSESELARLLKELRIAASRGDEEEIRARIKRIVPQYAWQSQLAAGPKTVPQPALAMSAHAGTD